MLILETSVLLRDFAASLLIMIKAKLVQDQISLPALNMEQAELPLHQYYQCLYRSVFTSALFEFKCCYGSTALAQSTFRVCIHKVVQNCP